MKSLVVVLCVLGAVAPAVVSHAQAPASNDGLASAAALLDEHHRDQVQGPALTLEEVERIALAQNPEIAVAARRVAMAQAHVPVAGTLDDPMAMYRGWGVPLQAALELQRRAKHVQHQPDTARSRQARSAHQHRGVGCGCGEGQPRPDAPRRSGPRTQSIQ